MTAVLLISGLILLFYGAEFLVKGSAGISLRAGIPSLVVGLTVVAYGTGSPELVVSIRSGLEGNGNLLLANTSGSQGLKDLCLLLSIWVTCGIFGLEKLLECLCFMVS